jgi:hypothetical protein
MIYVGGPNSFLGRIGFCALGAMCVFVVAESGRAQGTISASATLTETGTAGSEFEYSLTLDNTGTVDLNGLWYGWTQGSFNLPSAPTSIGAPTGWSGSAVGKSIEFKNNTGTTVAPEGSITFTFESTSSFSAMTTGVNDGDPTGESVAYNSAGDFGDQSDPGLATAPFQVTGVPEPSTVGLLATGLVSMSVWLRKRRNAA